VTLPVVWLPEADADLKEALAWYEGIHPDLGIRFLMAVESTVETIAEHPLHFQVLHKRVRRAGIRRFPYGLFFELESDRILVMACMHGRRNPKRWKIRGGAD
jgi:plasmid stabilization system protein ParE